MQPVENVVLRVRGTDWQGWKSVQIRRSVENIAGGFALGLTDRWVIGAAALPLAAGFACEIESNDTPMINGYIDKLSPSFSASDHGITVEGRDKSADIVDSSAVHSPGQWMGLTPYQLCSVLASPFNVPVRLDVQDGAIFPTFKLNVGEKAFDAMKRILKQREMIAYPDGKGGIILGKIGAETVTTVLAQGINVLSANANFDYTLRYSNYIVTGQKQGTDTAFGKACSVKGEYTDPVIERYRPLVLRPSQQGDASFMRKRAVWERTTRAAKSVTVSVTVQGWRMDAGELWPIGQLVHVRIPYLYLDQPLLIAETVFTKSSAGTVTELALKDPAAYAPEPEAASGTGGKSVLEMEVEAARRANAAAEAEKASMK